MALMKRRKSLRNTAGFHRLAKPWRRNQLSHYHHSSGMPMISFSKPKKLPTLQCLLAFLWTCIYDIHLTCTLYHTAVYRTSHCHPPFRGVSKRTSVLIFWTKTRSLASPLSCHFSVILLMVQNSREAHHLGIYKTLVNNGDKLPTTSGYCSRIFFRGFIQLPSGDFLERAALGVKLPLKWDHESYFCRRRDIQIHSFSGHITCQ